MSELPTVDLITSIKTLIKEKKKLSDTSIEVYLRNLKKLNDNKEMSDPTFKFLEDSKSIVSKLESFKETTKRNYLISIVSILSLYPELKALHDTYHALMMTKKAEISEVQSTGTKSDTQEENWVDWDSVKAQHEILADKVNAFYKKKILLYLKNH
jgi:sugar-specific transcriptional regulator TrmB